MKVAVYARVSTNEQMSRAPSKLNQLQHQCQTNVLGNPLECFDLPVALADPEAVHRNEVGFHGFVRATTDELSDVRDKGDTHVVDEVVGQLGRDQLTDQSVAPDRVAKTIAQEGWKTDHREVADWHRHPDYYRMHADVIRAFMHELDVDIHAPDTALVFAAQGSPAKHLKKGARYFRYAQELAKGIAREVGRKKYELAFRNAGPIRGKWTEPTLRSVMKSLEGARVVVVPIDSMVDDLSTLWTLDVEMAAIANGRDIRFHRTPLPHSTARFSELLGDVVEDLLRPEPVMGDLNLRRCLCRGTSTAFCLNAAS